MLSAYLPMCPENVKHVFMSQALKFAEILASGVVACSSEAVLHPFWQEKVKYQN